MLIIFAITILLEQSSGTFLSGTHVADFTENYATQNIGYEFEIIDLLGLGHRPEPVTHRPSLSNSAEKFLLEVYETLDDEKKHDYGQQYRKKRGIEDNFITKLDEEEIDKCNNIISFASKIPKDQSNNSTVAQPKLRSPFGLHMTFNTNDVPIDLKLVYGALRIYQSSHTNRQYNQSVTISLYRRNYSQRPGKRDYFMVNSFNSTLGYRGWLELNITKVLGKWMQHKSLIQATYGHELFVEVTSPHNPMEQLQTEDVGLISPSMLHELDKHPFIIGYFNGPELMSKIQTLRFKRDVMKRKQSQHFHGNRQQHQNIDPRDTFEMPKTCERLNFTLDFRDLRMHNWVIAPKKFEAFFCGGECNFPLSSRMNATNHAIVQTLMHLKQPNLPKPCCVPTVLGSISILHYLNEDAVNLSKYPQSVAKECGCH